MGVVLVFVLVVAVVFVVLVVELENRAFFCGSVALVWPGGQDVGDVPEAECSALALGVILVLVGSVGSPLGQGAQEVLGSIEREGSFFVWAWLRVLIEGSDCDPSARMDSGGQFGDQFVEHVFTIEEVNQVECDDEVESCTRIQLLKPFFDSHLCPCDSVMTPFGCGDFVYGGYECTAICEDLCPSATTST